MNQAGQCLLHGIGEIAVVEAAAAQRKHRRNAAAPPRKRPPCVGCGWPVDRRCPGNVTDAVRAGVNAGA
jgi:hypothetical protein